MSKNNQLGDSADQSSTQDNQKIVVRGKVTKLNQGTTNLEITTDSGHKITAYIGGKLRKNKIRILPGDEVSVELSSHNTAGGQTTIPRGRITHRHKT